MLDELSAAYEQGHAVAACLLSGLCVLHAQYPEQNRLLRVIRGFHGLHIYAFEYWVEYLLTIASSENGLDTATRFYRRSHELANQLAEIQVPTRGSQDESQAAIDNRLRYLENHPEIRMAAGAILAHRAIKAFDEPIQTSGTEPPPVPALLCLYEVLIYVTYTRDSL